MADAKMMASRRTTILGTLAGLVSRALGCAPRAAVADVADLTWQPASALSRNALLVEVKDGKGMSAFPLKMKLARQLGESQNGHFPAARWVESQDRREFTTTGFRVWARYDDGMVMVYDYECAPWTITMFKDETFTVMLPDALKELV